MNTERTLTIGQMLGKISSAEDSLERENACEELEEAIKEHFDKQFIMVCMIEAKKGNFSANVGKCLPPDMDDEGISYHEGDCGTVTAKW